LSDGGKACRTKANPLMDGTRRLSDSLTGLNAWGNCRAGLRRDFLGSTRHFFRFSPKVCNPAKLHTSVEPTGSPAYPTSLGGVRQARGACRDSSGGGDRRRFRRRV